MSKSIKTYFFISKTMQLISIKLIKIILTFCLISTSLFSQTKYFDFILTDKARYNPGDEVKFNIGLINPPNDCHIKISYKQMSKIVKNDSIFNLQQTTWSWFPPDNDFTGYLVEVFLINQNIILDQINTAVDVSSDYSRFPRYGFLSKYPQMTGQKMDDFISNLNDFHINAIQFYDWHYKHHLPLKGTPQNPAPYWTDIANRTNYFSTIKNYIDLAHSHNMITMAYNLLYGAVDNAELDGVSPQWYLYKDINHTKRDSLDLSFWGHYIYLLNPSNLDWQNYIFQQMKNVFTALDFDGWHIDQVGDRGTVYNYNGENVNLQNTFKNFLLKAKDSLNVNLIMNAVNQYGQAGIAQSPIDFLYTEVWAPSITFSSLSSIIMNNSQMSKGSFNSVVAAYVNHDLSEEKGAFNTPAVLYANAVIFAFGGTHIELGEHLLGHEYFPNENLQMTEELKSNLKVYYNFLTAYQNLLRDKGEITTSNLSTSDNNLLTGWPPELGKVSSFKKQMDSIDIFHLINFKGATTLDWRDNSGIQTEPNLIENLPIKFTTFQIENLDDSRIENLFIKFRTSKMVKKIWFASPDYNLGSPTELEFDFTNNEISFIIPKLKYWDMIVFEYDYSTQIENSSNEITQGFNLNQNYPNPFNSNTIISYSVPSLTGQDLVSTGGRDEQLPINSFVTLKVYDILGKEIATLVNENQEHGSYKINFDGENLPSGIYFYQLLTNSFMSTKKMILLK